MIIKELTMGECRAALGEIGLGRLACARDNQPYVVPFHFVYDVKDYLYAFSTLGQKIEWMRANPLVCVEVDSIKEDNDWVTIVVFGEYEELPSTEEFAHQRVYAYELLSSRPLWWQPAHVAGTHRTPSENAEPIYFRIRISEMTGHRAFADEAGGDRNNEQQSEQTSWWKRMWRKNQWPT